MSNFDYIRDPEEIYRKSFETIESEAELDRLPSEMRTIATRLIHACGMVDVVEDLVFSPNAAHAGCSALKSGCTIYCDVEMVRAGIIKRSLPRGVQVTCSLGFNEVPDHASSIGNTRSAAAVDFWENLDNSIAVIGNAPTALFRLLERVAEGAARPALIIGVPVGFVGAVESKRALAENPSGIEFITVHGRRGGSAMASSVVNALAGGLK